MFIILTVMSSHIIARLCYFQLFTISHIRHVWYIYLQNWVIWGIIYSIITLPYGSSRTF